MLSRVAESLDWTARSIERAENTSRLVDVTFHGLLDARVSDPEQVWRDLLRAVGRDDLFGEHFTEYTPRAVTEFLLWHPENPDSVTACVARARENLRGVREQISSEMREHLNPLHLLVARARPARVLEAPRVPGPRPGGLACISGRDQADALARRGVRVSLARRAPRARRHDGSRPADERADARRRVGRPALVPASVVRRLRGLPPARVGGGARRARCGLSPARSELPAFGALLRRALSRSNPVRLRQLAAARTLAGDARRQARVRGRASARTALARSVLGEVVTGLHVVGGELGGAYFATQVMLPGPYAQQQQQQ